MGILVGEHSGEAGLVGAVGTPSRGCGGVAIPQETLPYWAHDE